MELPHHQRSRKRSKASNFLARFNSDVQGILSRKTIDRKKAKNLSKLQIQPMLDPDRIFHQNGTDAAMSRISSVSGHTQFQDCCDNWEFLDDDEEHDDGSRFGSRVHDYDWQTSQTFQIGILESDEGSVCCQSEIAALRTECNVLRMEKEVADCKWKQTCLEMNQAIRMARILRTAVESLFQWQGTEGISNSGAHENLKQQAKDLQDRIAKLKKSADCRRVHSREPSLDASLQLKMERLQISLPVGTQSSSLQANMGEFSDSRNSTEHGTVESSSSQDGTADSLSVVTENDVKPIRIVHRIAKQIKAEAEELLGMEKLLQQVQEEMEQIKQEKELWEVRALSAEAHIVELEDEKQEWKTKMQLADTRIARLRSEVSHLTTVVELTRQRHAQEQSRWLDVGTSWSRQSTLQRIGTTYVPKPNSYVEVGTSPTNFPDIGIDMVHLCQHDSDFTKMECRQNEHQCRPWPTDVGILCQAKEEDRKDCFTLQTQPKNGTRELPTFKKQERPVKFLPLKRRPLQRINENLCTHERRFYLPK